jgi:hypothetical protein
MGALPQLARTQADFARLLLARRGPGDRERACELLRRARETAEALDMSRFAGRLPAPPEHEAPSPARAPVRAERGLLRRDGDVWKVGLGAEEAVLKHAKGLSFLATLLAHPGREFHVLDLLERDAPLDSRVEPGFRAAAAGDAGVMLDPEARAAYKRRLDDLRDELEEAERFNDPHRAERARTEMEFLGNELARAVGLGGRDRRAASAAERARVNVGRAISHVMKKITEVSPAASEHLQASVRTGMFCVYEPRLPVEWSLTP